MNTSSALAGTRDALAINATLKTTALTDMAMAEGQMALRAVQVACAAAVSAVGITENADTTAKAADTTANIKRKATETAAGPATKRQNTGATKTAAETSNEDMDLADTVVIHAAAAALFASTTAADVAAHLTIAKATLDACLTTAKAARAAADAPAPVTSKLSTSIFGFLDIAASSASSAQITAEIAVAAFGTHRDKFSTHTAMKDADTALAKWKDANDAVTAAIRTADKAVRRVESFHAPPSATDADAPAAAADAPAAAADA